MPTDVSEVAVGPKDHLAKGRGLPLLEVATVSAGDVAHLAHGLEQAGKQQCVLGLGQQAAPLAEPVTRRVHFLRVGDSEIHPLHPGGDRREWGVAAGDPASLTGARIEVGQDGRERVVAERSDKGRQPGEVSVRSAESCSQPGGAEGQVVVGVDDVSTSGERNGNRPSSSEDVRNMSTGR